MRRRISRVGEQGLAEKALRGLFNRNAGRHCAKLFLPREGLKVSKGFTKLAKVHCVSAVLLLFREI